jgi:hypothetical protein
MTSHATLPWLLPRNDGRPAIREKDRGIRQTFTWPSITARCAISRWGSPPAAFAAGINWR